MYFDEVVILAAGRGLRMGAATSESPKSLIPLIGKHTLDRNLANIRAHLPMTPVSIITGYKGEHFKGVANVSLEHNHKWRETGPVGSLVPISSRLAHQQTLVLYGDVHHPNEFFEAIAKIQGEFPLIGSFSSWRKNWENRYHNPLDDLESFRVNSSGLLTEIGQKVKQIDCIHGQFSGALAMTSQLWTWALGRENFAHMDVTGLLSLAIRDQLKIGVVDFDGPWYEIDTPADFKLAQKIARGLD